MLDYYFSGVPSYKDEEVHRLAQLCPHRLLSCHGDYVKAGHKWAKSAVTNKGEITLLLDSGAFTAWNKSHEMHLHDLMPVYFDFMNKYWSSLKEIYLINLDKIPGSPGRTAEYAEIQEACEISDKNYQILIKEFGPRVLPVFHQNEDEARLREICQMSEYICVSPRNDLPEGQRVRWSHEVHGKIPRTTRTHGLAATGMLMMETVPWTSVDSASWVFTAATGNISICINGRLLNLGVSEQSPTRFLINQHFNTLSELAKDAVRERVLRNSSYTIEQLMVDHAARMSFTMTEIMYWNANHHVCEFEEVATLFEL
jgi:hypothetical protein